MKQHYTLIKNARIVRVGRRVLEDCDILVHHSKEGAGNRIAAIEKHIDRRTLTDCTLSAVNAGGNLVLPSFTDLAVTLREPGSMYKEDIASLLKAATAGGYRAFLAYFEPDPRFSTQDALSYISSVGKGKTIAFYPAFHGNEADWETLFKAGGRVVTDRYLPLADEGAAKRVMEKAKEQKRTLTVFPHTVSLDGDGALNSRIASMMGQKGLSPVSEEIAVIKTLLLAENIGCRVHLSGVSTARSLSFIREAKRTGVAVTCDVSPYHFFFDESAILYHGNAAKLMPPLRTEEDRMAVIEAIVDGTVDAIASHHTPNDKNETAKPTAQAPFGAVSLETVFSACVEALLLPGYIDVYRLAELLAVAPYAILSGCMGQNAVLHPLAAGEPADFNLVSLDRSITVEETTLKGRAKNTPFMGMTLQGRMEKSFLAGN